MGLMDKVKAQAEQALAKSKVVAEKGKEKGKEGLAQGQAKVKEMQDKKAADKPDAPAGDYKLDDV
ncbi:MAG: hypothetical protein ACJ735_17575 [Actinomycetes bacterium]